MLEALVSPDMLVEIGAVAAKAVVGGAGSS